MSTQTCIQVPEHCLEISILGYGPPGHCDSPEHSLTSGATLAELLQQTTPIADWRITKESDGRVVARNPTYLPATAILFAAKPENGNYAYIPFGASNTRYESLVLLRQRGEDREVMRKGEQTIPENALISHLQSYLAYELNTKAALEDEMLERHF